MFFWGTGISLSRGLTERLVDSGVCVEGRAQYIVLVIHNERIGILNVYAPNVCRQRASFWNALCSFPLPQAKWILSGNFDINELGDDRSGRLSCKNMSSRELKSWTRFILQLGILDVFYADEYRRIRSKRYTRCQQRPTPHWARLNWFYTSNDLRVCGGRYDIWPTMEHILDHASIFLDISFVMQRKKMHTGFKRELIYDEDAMMRFERAWRDAMSCKETCSKGTKITTTLK